MTREQKILIAAGLLVIVLYVGAVASGRGSGEGDANSPVGGLVGVIAGWLGSSADADRVELSADCFNEAGQLGVEGSCTLKVAPSERDLRVVRLRTDQPVSVTARLPQSGRTATVEVAAGDETSVAVDGDGGDIALTCTCVLTVLNGG